MAIRRRTSPPSIRSGRCAASMVGLFLMSVANAFAQNAPPFNGSGAGLGFDPEIRVVFSGVISDVQVAVSEDRRYVTINSSASSTGLARLNVFQAEQARAAVAANSGPLLGYVGNGGFLADEVDPNLSHQMAAAAGPRFTGMPTQTSPSEILRVDPTANASVLRQSGMFRLTSARPGTDSHTDGSARR